MAQVNTIQDFPAGQYKIFNGEDWAKTRNISATSERKHPQASQTFVAFDDAPAVPSDRWIITPFEEGFRIQNVASRAWARDDFWTVGLQESSEFDPKKCKWYIKSVGNGKFNICVPNEDRVWTILTDSPDHPKIAFIPMATGSETQLISFEKLEE